MARAVPTKRAIRRPASGAAVAIALAALGLGACSVTRQAFGPLQYDKSSAAAEAIATTDVSKQAYPSFLQVPSQPEDVRPISAWNRNIFDILAARRQMDAFQVTYPQNLYGGEAFAQQSRAEAAPPPSPDQSKTAGDKTQAFVTQGRARATPPSPAP